MRLCGHNICEAAFTLIEVLLVVVIIGILATVAFKSLDTSVYEQRRKATLEEMEELAKAIVGDKRLYSQGMRSDFGYFGDVGALPPNLDALVSNPGGYSTWQGPYIVNDLDEDIDGYKRDAWGDYYTYSGGTVISSNGGPGASIQVKLADSMAELDSNTVSGYLFDGDGDAPQGDSSSVTVALTIPDGAGSTTQLLATPSASGRFEFANCVPIGNHLVKAIHSALADTVSRYVSVLPGTPVDTEIRFPGNIW